MAMSPVEVKELKEVWEDDSIPWNQHIDSEKCYDTNCQVYEVEPNESEWLELRGVKEPCWSFTWSGCYEPDCLHHIREKILFRWWPQQPEFTCRFDYWTECNIDECQQHLPNKRATGWFPGLLAQYIQREVGLYENDRCGSRKWQHCFVDKCEKHYVAKLRAGLRPQETPKNCLAHFG